MKNVQMVMDAIQAVRLRAQVASQQGDFTAFKQSMEELLALQVCLESEVQKMLKVA